jgi:O-succinylbenzoic acid--CoA ligase
MSELQLHLSSHLSSANLFFGNKTYLDLKKDILDCANKLVTDTETVILNEKDPYLFIVLLYSIWINNKTPILVSPNEKKWFLLSLKKNINFSEAKFSELPPLFSDKDELKIQIKKSKIYLLSSGTTGSPKIIVHSLYSLLKHIESFNTFFKTSKAETYFLNLPLNHISGLQLLLRCFFNHSQIVQHLESPIDYISLVPTQIEKALNENLPIIELLKRAKAVLIGGSKLNDETQKRLSQLNIPFFETYGMTETASFIALNNTLLPQNKIYTDQECRVYIQSPAIFEGCIINNQFIPREDIKFCDSYYFRSNDLGTILNGKFYFQERADNIINSGGEKISPAKIKRIVEIVTQDNSIIPVGIKDPKWGERLVVFYNNPKDLTLNQLVEVKEKLVSFEFPKNFVNLFNKNTNKLKLTQNDYYNFFLESIFDHKIINNHHNFKWLVIIHGFMETLNDWAFLIDELSEKFNLIFINLPGHGNTTSDNFFNLDDLIFKLKNFIENLTIDFHLIGYSLGGRICLELAKNITPQSLTLISSGIGLKDENEKIDRNRSDQALFNLVHNQEDLINFLNGWYDNPIFAGYKNLPNYLQTIADKSDSNYKEWQNAINLMSPAVFPIADSAFNFLTNIHFPLNYIYGVNDLKYMAIGNKLLKSNNKNLKVFSINNAAHNLHKSQPTALLKLLKELL